MEKYTNLKLSRVNLQEAIPLAKPFTLLIETTSLCNFSCTQCFHSREDFHSFIPRGFLDNDDYNRLLADLKTWPGEKLKVIRFIGFGEPMLHRQFGDMLIECRNADVCERMEVTSNCSLLTPKIAQKLLDASLDYLRISIYAASQERHEQITKSKISVEQIYNNIVYLRKLRGAQERPFIYIKMLDSFDEAENKRFFDLYTDLADEIALEQPHSWLNNHLKDQEELHICPQPFKMMSIHFNGDVILCDPDWKSNTFIGNVFQKGIQNIWNNEKHKNFLALQLKGLRKNNPSCRECSFLNRNYVMDNLDNLLGDQAILQKVCLS